MIIGWQSLIAHTGLTEGFIRRAMAFYGFPKAKRDHRNGKGLSYSWNQFEVDQWMKNNRREAHGR